MTSFGDLLSLNNKKVRVEVWLDGKVKCHYIILVDGMIKGGRQSTEV